MSKGLSKSLSTDEIKALNPDCKVLTYADFMRYDTLQDLLKPFNCVIFLYMSSHNYGHYCALWQNEPHVLHFYDPYGVYIDKQLNFISSKKNKELGQEIKHLSELILKDQSIKTIYVNHHKFQKLKKGVNTCGRHVLVRTLLRNLSEKEYEKLFKGKDADRVVVKVTDALAKEKGVKGF